MSKLPASVQQAIKKELEVDFGEGVKVTFKHVKGGLFRRMEDLLKRATGNKKGQEASLTYYQQMLLESLTHANGEELENLNMDSILELWQHAGATRAVDACFEALQWWGIMPSQDEDGTVILVYAKDGKPVPDAITRDWSKLRPMLAEESVVTATELARRKREGDEEEPEDPDPLES